MFKILFLTAFAIFSNTCLTAQSGPADSLLSPFRTLPDDTVTLRKLYELAEHVSESDLETSRHIYGAAYALAWRIDAPTWRPKLQLGIGRNEANLGRPDSALFYFNLARQGFEKQGDQRGLANVLTKIRWVYNYLGDFEKGNVYILQAIKIYERLGDAKGLANAYTYLGENLYNQNNYQDAARYIQKAYELQKQHAYDEDLACSAQSLGDSWLQLGDYDKALAFQNEGLSIRRRLGLDIDIGLSLNSRANVLKYMKRYPEALRDYQEALHYARRTNFGPLQTAIESNIGHVYNLTGKFAEALPFHLKIRQDIETGNQLEKAAENLRLLAEAYAGVGRFDSAYYYQNLKIELSDSLLNAENLARMAELQTRYESEQKELKIAAQTHEIRQNRQLFWAVLGGLVLALLGAALLFRLTRQLRRRNREKEILLKEIHHRVKNNLQVLSSLLHLQSRYIQDEAALHAVREGQNRVDAMGLIHQKLYLGDRLTGVDMQEFLPQLAQILLDSFGLHEGRVAIRCEVQPIFLDVDTAIPLSLIANELLTNALKHAFPEDRSGTVTARLWKNQAGRLCLEIADDGVGAPLLSAANSPSFGSSLAQMLGKKLKGQWSYPEQERGFATRIEFFAFKER